MIESQIRLETEGRTAQVSRRHPVDLVFLARQTLGDRELEAEVLRMFVDISSGYFRRLRTCSDAGEAAHCLHSLKGASAGVGAIMIAVQARQAEEELRATGRVSEESIADIGLVVEEATAYITGLLDLPAA